MPVVEARRHPFNSTGALAEDPRSILWGELCYFPILATEKRKLHASPKLKVANADK